jgi:hypothetical protein
MHWFIYTLDEHGRLASLRVRESAERPAGLVLNDGFKTPEEGFALMGQYLDIDREGFAHVDQDKAARPIKWLARIKLAYLVEPRLVWLTTIALIIGAIDLLIISLHILGV